MPADTARAAGTPADTVPAADTVFHNLPSLDRPGPDGHATASRVWTLDDIMASGANTLLELMADVPGFVPLPAGDYGTPAAFSMFGTGGGGVRVLRDGFEVVPLAGGVVDLQRVSLAGVGRVRLQRRGTRSTVELWSLRYEDGRPLSIVEAGTGDLDTNVFRGTFADPTAFGGSVGVALERADSRGPAANETGNRTGSWFRYQLHREDRAGLAFEFHRGSSSSEVAAYAADVQRTDLTLRGRLRVVEGVVVEAYTGRSSHDVDDPRPEYGTEGGQRTQHGVRLALDRAGLWARGAYRRFGGDDLPGDGLELEAGYLRDRIGGFEVHTSREAWAGRGLWSRGASAWLGPLLGISLFGSWDEGDFGSRAGPLQDEAPPPDVEPAPPPPTPLPAFHLTERTALRAGAEASWVGVRGGAALLRVDNDVFVPLGLEPDRGAAVVAGAARNGWEAWASLPMPLEGLRLQGSLQRWDEPGPYLPERIYQGSFEFHDTPMESGNLELWGSLGVRGHDPMLVSVPVEAGGDPGAGLQVVPFHQSWYARIQVRIVTVRIFIGWENFTIRRNLQAFPGRLLPATRAFYGIRWTMWN